MSNIENLKDIIENYSEELRHLSSGEIKNLQALLEDIRNRPKSIWDLDVNDEKEYWLLHLDGSIGQSVFYTDYDEDIRVMGNAFLTKEEAKFERERRKIEAVMRRYARPFVKDEANWIIEYQYQDKEIYAYWYGNYHAGAPCFESEEIAEKVIEEIGEDRLLKYWFGVE